MNFWILLWKSVFILSVSAFGLLAVWVTFQGARDIKSLFASLRRQHESGDGEAQEATEERLK